MPEIIINKKKYEVESGITIIQACEQADIEIPRFCYHERLAIAGNCRMCLVEVVGGPPKPVASCAMQVNDGMEINTESEMVKKAREGVMEFLLANHPLDCPICDQGGECDLQDQAYQYGKGISEYEESKRAVKDKNMGPLIKTHMTRCIHCTRCVRFIEDVAGTNELGAVKRGENMEISTYIEKSITSELSGNIIDLCPVGALTSKPYAFKARSWELTKTDTIDVMDALGSNIRVDSKGLEIMRILPRVNEEINEEWISDKARFCYDGIKYQRLDKAFAKIDGKVQATDTDRALQIICDNFKDLKPEQAAILSGKLSSLEEIHILNEISKQAQIIQKECRLNDEKLDAGDKSSYLFNSSVAGIEEADFCLIIGSNISKDAPVLNSRIRKRYLTGEMKIAAIGCDFDLNYKLQNLGNDLSELSAILANKSAISKDLKLAQKPMMIIGNEVICGEKGSDIIDICKQIAQKHNFIQQDWNGYNFLSKSTGLINGLALDFTSEGGIKNILQRCEDGRNKFVILHGVDDDIDFEKLQNCFVVYIGSHGDQGAHIADVILPGATSFEKDASYINIEGKIQKSQKAIFSVTEVAQDAEIIIKLAKKLNLDLGFNEISALKQNLFSTIDYDQDSDIIKSIFTPSNKAKIDIKGKIIIKDYDFYLTNPIARASRILSQCSNELHHNKEQKNQDEDLVVKVAEA